MPNTDPLINFADALEKHLGPPKGLTDQDVQADLKSLHGPVFAALNKMNRTLNYQDNDLSLKYQFGYTDRAKRSAACAITLAYGGRSHGFSVKFTPEAIQTNDPVLTQGTSSQFKEWKKEEGVNFVSELCAIVIKML